MDFSELPLLCVSLIVDKLTTNAYGDTDQSHKVCKNASYLAMVGNPMFTMMARMLWEIVDEGCTRNARAMHATCIKNTWLSGVASRATTILS
jgi:hypothetical protein